jgi:putative ABC transport system substrate-binding protein
VGWLFPGPAGGVPPRVVAFKDGLLQLGFQSPKQVDVVTRIADSNHARLEPMARELLALNVDVIAAFSPSAINALLKVVKETGHKVPIVAMSLVSDPVDSGWVKSLAQPGGNVTGLFLDFPEFSKKWLELLKEMIPGLTKVAVFWDPPTGTMQRAGVEQAARILNVELDIMTVRRPAAGVAAVRRQPEVGRRPLAQASNAGGVPVPGLFARRRIDGIRTEPARHPSPGRNHRRQDPHGQEARRSAGRAAFEIRNGGESEDCQGAGRDGSDFRPAARRRCDRIAARSAAAAGPRNWKNENGAEGRHPLRFGSWAAVRRADRRGRYLLAARNISLT